MPSMKWMRERYNDIVELGEEATEEELWERTYLWWKTDEKPERKHLAEMADDAYLKELPEKVRMWYRS